MKLYYAPAACSLAAHIVAREAGIALEIERVNNKEKKTDTGADYLAINPKGAVPALAMNDGGVLTENAVIMQYLVANAPNGAGLLPQDGAARWRTLEMTNYIATEVHKGFSPLFNPATPAEYKPTIIEQLNKKIAFLDKTLADRPYLTGESFTIADAYAYTILNWTRFTGIDLAPYPNVQAFMERVSARPAVKLALQEEGLLKAA